MAGPAPLPSKVTATGMLLPMFRRVIPGATLVVLTMVPPGSSAPANCPMAVDTKLGRLAVSADTGSSAKAEILASLKLSASSKSNAPPISNSACPTSFCREADALLRSAISAFNTSGIAIPAPVASSDAAPGPLG